MTTDAAHAKWKSTFQMLNKLYGCQPQARVMPADSRLREGLCHHQGLPGVILHAKGHVWPSKGNNTLQSLELPHSLQPA